MSSLPRPFGRRRNSTYPWVGWWARCKGWTTGPRRTSLTEGSGPTPDDGSEWEVLLRIMVKSKTAQLIAALSFLTPAGARAAGLNALPNLALYERYVAIDGSCSWPRLTLLPGGEISALIWPHPNHGLVAGAAECWNSTDGGRTWHRIGVPVPNASADNRMNVAAGLASDGAYTALVAGWTHCPPGRWSATTDEERKHRSQFHRPPSTTSRAIPAVSRDGGRTWSQYGEVADLPQSSRHLTPYGPIRPLSGARMGVMLYGETAYFFASADQGRTWGKLGQLGSAGDYNETSWIILANRDFYAAARSSDDHGLDGFGPPTGAPPGSRSGRSPCRCNTPGIWCGFKMAGSC